MYVAPYDGRGGDRVEATLLVVAKALADETRIQLLAALAREGELSCGELVERCAVSQPTVSHHLKVLVEAGLVRVRQAGQRSLHVLDVAGFRDTAAALLRLAGALPPEHRGSFEPGDPAQGLPDIGPGNVD